MTLKVQTDRLLQTTALSMIFVIGWALMAWAATDSGSTKNKNFQIQHLQWENNNQNLRIKGDSSPVFTSYNLFNPSRIIIDIADGVFSESSVLPLDFTSGPISRIKGELLTDQVPEIAQLQLIRNEAGSDDYKIVREQNDIVIQFSQAKKVEDDQVEEKIVIQDITVEKLPLETRIHIRSNRPIVKYTTTGLDKDMGHMPRVCLDLTAVECEKIDLDVKDSPLARVSTEMLAADDGIRIVMESAKVSNFLYDIQTNENGLDVIITDSEEDVPEQDAVLAATGLIENENPAGITESKTPATMKPVSVKKDVDSGASSSPATDDFNNLSFAGYTAQKISVDFYKIDLHNVFRLIGDISQKNIVVDEAVNGSLTLSLNNVPWDFVLDIILNLKDLQKEERFNTIVISPKDKGFAWPENTAKNLDIEVETDPLKVKKRLEINNDSLVARKIIRQAREMEKAGNYQQAAVLYEKAINSWPNNSVLAERLASIYLARLGFNAKAAFFAQKAMAIEPDNSKAVLTAAVALANMEKIQEAKKYFEIAVNVSQPSKQALASYAAFCEQNDDFSVALDLLNHFEEIYGSSLQIMISKARVFDKTGRKDLADQEYRSVLNSGENIPKTLRKYIQKRLAE